VFFNYNVASGIISGQTKSNKGKRKRIMKVLVAYMSRTGNTKKVAEVIYEEIRVEKEIMAINKVKSIEDYNLTFLGFPIHNLGPDKKTVKFLEKHCVNNRNVALFITHAAPEGHEDLLPILDKFRQAASGANIVAMFDCQGELSKMIKRIMSVLPDAKYRLWSKQDNSQGQPNKARLDKARAFSNDVIEKFTQN